MMRFSFALPVFPEAHLHTSLWKDNRKMRNNPAQLWKREVDPFDTPTDLGHGAVEETSALRQLLLRWRRNGATIEAKTLESRALAELTIGRPLPPTARIAHTRRPYRSGSFFRDLLPIVGLLVLCGAFTAASLSAHAILMDSSPAPHGAATGPDVVIRLKFNSRIDGPRSRLWVENAGSLQTVGIAPQPSPEILVGHAKDLKPGPSRLRWQVLAIDGHITRGELSFIVR
jgi:methionine-rich copper-binding protein CopC